MAQNALRVERPRQKGLPQVLKSFLALLLGLTSICVLVEAVCRWVLHLPYPYNWPLFKPGNPFYDLTMYQARFQFFHTRFFFNQPGWAYMYPAPLSLFYKLYYLSGHPVLAFVATLCMLLIGAAWLLVRALMRFGLSWKSCVGFLAVVVCCSYPFFFELQQGNLELIVWAFVATGIVTFAWRHAYIAAVCFGVAAAMKVFPFIFLGLLLSKKLFRPVLLLLATAVGTTLLTLWILCPDLATSFKGIQQGLADFQTYYFVQNSAVGVDHSLFSVVKAAGIAFHRSNGEVGFRPEFLARCLRVYLPLAAVAGTCLYFLVIRKLPVINQVICLTAASILLPPVSYNYTLIHLYAPWALLVLCVLEQRERLAPGPERANAVPGMWAALACFAVLFAPESEIIFHAHALVGQIKAVVLLLLFFVALRRPFASSLDGDQVAGAGEQTVPLADLPA